MHYAISVTRHFGIERYATTVDGSPITEHSALIHEFYGTECAEPVHLVIDASLAENTIGIKAFVSRPLAVANRALANQFQQIPAQMESMEAEAIALDTMARGQEDKWFDKDSDGLSNLDSDTDTLHRSMKRLLEMLETTSNHVDQVVSGSIQPDNEVGREIAATLAAVPRVRPEVFDRVFNDSLQDLLMATYLSNLTRTQLAIASKLKEVLN
jgi:translation initiation factor 3 subunit F